MTEYWHPCSTSTVQVMKLQIRPWFDSDCCARRRHVRVLERHYCRTKVDTDRAAWHAEQLAIHKFCQGGRVICYVDLPFVLVMIPHHCYLTMDQLRMCYHSPKPIYDLNVNICICYHPPKPIYDVHINICMCYHPRKPKYDLHVNICMCYHHPKPKYDLHVNICMCYHPPKPIYDLHIFVVPCVK